MMNRQISRRTMLKAAGATIALPWLEAMASPFQSKPPLRLAFVFAPMGVRMDAWTPKGEGKDFELTPTLEPLKNVKDDLLVLTGLDHRRDDQAGNPHPRGSGTWLSSAAVGKTDSAGFSTDVSIDQLAARELGRETRLMSLELASQRGIGKHASNISWRAPGSPMGTEANPKKVFLRLFGDPKGDELRKSVLDQALRRAQELKAELGRADQQKLDEYLDSVRAIERQIQAIERDKKKGNLPEVEMPETVPADLPGRLRLLADLVVLAFQTDTTRVATFMLALENGAGVGPLSYRHLGVASDHHSLTHFDKSTEEDWTRQTKLIDRFHIESLAYLLEKMKGIKEGDGTLLDHSIVVYGSGIQLGNRHNWDSVPMLVAGRGGGTVTPGRHVRLTEGAYAGPDGVRDGKGVPLANLWLSLLDRAGAKLEKVADSTGRLDALKV